MRTSDQLNDLIASLIAFQNEMPVLKKDSSVSMELKSGRKIQYDYIELGAIVEKSKAVLAKNNLSIIQPRGTIEGKPALFTMLMHKSGQYIQTYTMLDLTGKTEQEKGSVITYNSRYDYVGMLRFGLLDEDDDGNAATGNNANITNKSKSEQFNDLKKKNVNPEDLGKHMDEVRKVQGLLEDPGLFIFPVGKFMGKKLNEMKIEDIDANIDYWSKQKKKGTIPPKLEEFLLNGYEYLVKKGFYPPPYKGAE